MQSAAVRFDTVGADLAHAVDALRSTLAGLGDYLGSDEQGMQFKAGYDPKSAEAQRVVGDIAAALRSLSPALGGSVADHAGNDGAAGGGFDRFLHP